MINTKRLSDVPELIFLNLEMTGLKNFDFLNEFASLSDFIRNKCKIVIVTAQPILEIVSNTSIVRYLQKPLDVFQLQRIYAINSLTSPLPTQQLKNKNHGNHPQPKHRS
ncbi:MAG: hypothetical protein IPI10_16205 [Bacteroidetes bacterium]|nr:hypothetical protein [Bacteroidota bacterium]